MMMRNLLMVWAGMTTCAACAAVNLIPYPREVRETGGVWKGEGAEPPTVQIKVIRVSDLPHEGYRLDVTPAGATITATDDAGVFYARQTLSQLVTAAADGKSFTVPCVAINDAPAFGWRGMLIDEGRHFFGKEVVKRMIDTMSAYKFNVLHWHLTEDQGWRLDVPGMPELAKYGSVRPRSPAHGARLKIPGKFQYESTAFTTEKYGPFAYSRADLEEIVAYAAAHHIRVVPEFEMPGHSRGVLAAYPHLACFPEHLKDRMARDDWGITTDVMCVGNDDVLRFLEKVADYLCEVFPGEVIHIGGDECPTVMWEKCPKCQARMKAEGLKSAAALQGWLTRRMAAYFAKKGKRIMGWDEILAGGLAPKTAIGQSWRLQQKSGAGTELVSAASGAAQGYDMVMSPHTECYFDYQAGLAEDPFQKIGPKLPIERVYQFNPLTGIPQNLQKHILGGQCNLWSEYIWNLYDLEWRAWPRGLAMAEVLWTSPAVRDFDAFALRAAEHRRRLIARGVNCSPLK